MFFPSAKKVNTNTHTCTNPATSNERKTTIPSKTQSEKVHKKKPTKFVLSNDFLTIRSGKGCFAKC